MTLFAVACAGMYPVLHLGRPWLAYWLLPYPNTMGMWPQFRSPLIWDVFAVSTYATVSLLFWYVGLIPDLATLRDRARTRVAKIVYGFGAMGWRGSAAHWHNYETAYLLLAGLATPLVISVHTVVSFDFAAGVIPGWHATIFPPYFVAGAIYAGFAMVLTLAIPLRIAFGLEDFITTRHLQNMGKVMLATGLIVAYGYMVEIFFAWYSANDFEEFMVLNRIQGPYAGTGSRSWSATWWCRSSSGSGASAPRRSGSSSSRCSSTSACGSSATSSSWCQPPPRLPAVVLGHVPRHDLGLGHLHRHHRPLPDAALPLHPLPADDLDLRDAHHRAGRPEGRRVHGDSGMTSEREPEIYGLMAEFHSAEELIEAAQRVRAAGYTRVDAFTPYPIEELSEALGHHRSKLPLIVLAGGIAGALTGYGLQYWASVIEYPMNIGGRPFHSWPAFIVPTFEMTILFAALSAVLGMFFLNGLPMPYHPVFNVPRFALASRDRYFLVIEARDGKFDRAETARFLEELHAFEVSDVDH